jgi:delta-aminolevulinic acid dehydratase/porphobilinogen synthase
MLIATAQQGWGDLDELVRESTMGIVRAAADLIISYWASVYNRFFGSLRKFA